MRKPVELTEAERAALILATMPGSPYANRASHEAVLRVLKKRGKGGAAS